jgi:hypothetical protein
VVYPCRFVRRGFRSLSAISIDEDDARAASRLPFPQTGSGLVQSEGVQTSAGVVSIGSKPMRNQRRGETEMKSEIRKRIHDAWRVAAANLEACGIGGTFKAEISNHIGKALDENRTPAKRREAAEHVARIAAPLAEAAQGLNELTLPGHDVAARAADHLRALVTALDELSTGIQDNVA